MKNISPTQVLDLRLQIDHVNLKKFQLFGENRGATKSARLFLILIGHRVSKNLSVGDEFTEVTIF